MKPPATNRSMFRRLLRRLLFANRGRLFVILLALSAGAAVSAALLNLQTDAKHRLTTEFRAFGPNVIVVPKNSESALAATLDENVLLRLPPISATTPRVNAFAYLFVLADVSSLAHGTTSHVVVAGVHTQPSGKEESSSEAGAGFAQPDKQKCFVGRSAATHLHLSVGDQIVLHAHGQEERCAVNSIVQFGDNEDNQVFPHLDVAQRLAGLPRQLSLVQLSVPGTAAQIDRYVAEVRQRIPDVDVRPLRQFSEAQAKIYSRISGLLTAATALILVLTALCVMAAMTNIAAERKHDVGMMKAIGGSARGILNLFLTEAALLGLAGGLIGAAAGIVLSIALGKAVFGIAAAPRLIVYPVSVALTVIVAIVGAYPLRRLANVRPATIFRGDA